MFEVNESLKGTSNGWPALEHWVEIFEREGLRPRMWDFESRPRNKRELAEHVRMRLRSTRRNAERLNGTGPVKWTPVLDVINDAGYEAELYAARLVLSENPWQLPPYFPGCRVGLVCMTNGMLDRRRKQILEQYPSGIIVLR